MLPSNLKYDDYKNINEIIEGYTNIDAVSLPLANRPLPQIKQCPCAKENRNDLSKVKPYYNTGEFQKSTGNPMNEIPVIIQKNRDQYLVLEEKRDDVEANANVYADSWADKKKGEPIQPKMDMATQFYVGSLSVVALFIFFRVIQKSH